MKLPLSSGYSFIPTQKRLDLSGVQGFDIRRLYGIVNLTAGVLIYAVGNPDLGRSALAGAVLTLVYDTTSMSETDDLMIIYDDGTLPLPIGAATASRQDAGNGALASLATGLGGPADAAPGSDTAPGSLIAKVTRLLATQAGIATTLNGAATEATLVAIKSALLAQVDFETSIVTDGTSFYVRRESYNEGAGTISVTFTDLAGNPASPNVANLVPASSSNTRTVETALFDVVTAGTGTSVGDVVARVIVYDTRTNSIVASYWHNLTTGTALGTAPAASALTEQARNLAVGAATSALQGTGNASLSNIATGLGGPSDAAAGSDAAASSLIGLFRRSLGYLSALAGAVVSGRVQVGAPANSPVPVSDGANLPFTTAVGLSANTPFTAGRAIGMVCTAAGTLTLTLAGGGSINLPVYPGWQTFPFAATQVGLSGGANGAVYNLN